MAPSKAELKALNASLENVKKILSAEEKWGPSGDYTSQIEALVVALSELEKNQKPFALIDGDMSFKEKSDRLFKWLGTHPDFKSSSIRLVDDLPSEAGGRGVVAEADVSKGQAVFQVPSSCMVSTSSALRTTDLGLVLLQPTNIKELPTVVLTLHMMVEHAKCVLKQGKDKTNARTSVMVNAPNWSPNEVDPAFLAFGKKLGVDLSSYEPKHDEATCKDDSHGHSHAHAHSHGESHGHSHGGKPCTGHGHGAAPAPAPAASHGHSHNGKPCGGHGHGGHGHGGGAEEQPKLVPVALDLEGHPWGSHYRPYLSVLPEKPSSCLYFGPAEHRLLKGLALGYEIAKFIRNSTVTYLKLYEVFGMAAQKEEGLPLLGTTFAEHFTWAGFKWAMSCAMSRQNRVPFQGGPDPLSGMDYCLAMIPLYDMVNSSDPTSLVLAGKKDELEQLAEITSFFLPSPTSASAGGVLVLEAVQDFKAGEEVTMSYGSRQSSQLVQFQGFLPSALVQAASILERADRARYRDVVEKAEKEFAEAAAKEGHKVPPAASIAASAASGELPSKEQEEAALALLSSEYAIVEAAVEGQEKDDFVKIKRSLLQSLEIKPDNNARRHLDSFPAALMIRETIMAAQKAAYASAMANNGKPNLSAEERKRYNDTVDTITWGLPFAFQVYGNGVVSADLVSYLRVISIDSKADAAKALRSVDAARQELAAKVKEARAKQEAMEKKRAERMFKKLEAAKAKMATAAAGGSAAAGAGDAEAEADDDDDEDEDIPVSFQLAMSELSPNNELEAQASLLEVLDYAIEQADYNKAVATAAAAGAAGAGASTSSDPLFKAAESYREFQLNILRRARVKALVRLDELNKAVLAMNAAGDKSTASASGSEPSVTSKPLA